MSLVDVERLRKIAEIEFSDIVEEAFVPDMNELRIILIDGSFLDCSSDSSGSILGDLPETIVDPHYHALWAIQ